MSATLATLTFAALRAANSARQDEWCPDQKPDLSFRGNEMAGEVGEACNIIKKLERERQGWAGSRATVQNLADELADVVICADLVAESQGIDLGAAVACKFDDTSNKRGLATRLTGYDAEAKLSFVYRNWRGVEARRTVVPFYIWHGVTEWHTDAQWFLRAFDVSKGNIRDFAMKDMREVGEDDDLITCLGCELPLGPGEKVQREASGETLCENCAFTFGEIKAQHDEALATGRLGNLEPEGIKAFAVAYAAHIAAAGSPDDKPLYVIEDEGGAP